MKVNGEHQKLIGRRSLESRDKQEALAILKELDVKMAERAGLIDRSPDPSLSIQVGVQAYLDFEQARADAGQIAPATIKRYRPFAERFISWATSAGIRTWPQLQDPNLAEFHAHLTRSAAAGGLGLASRTAYLETNLVKSVNKHLIDKAKTLNPQHRLKLKLRRDQSNERYCPSCEEVDLLLETCAGRPEWNVPGCAFAIGAFAGLRSNEILQLDRSTIILHAAEPCLQVVDEGRLAGSGKRTKNRKGREVPIHPQLKPHLERLLAQPGRQLWLGPKGGRLDSDDLLKTLKRVTAHLLKHGTPDRVSPELARLVVHGLRHFFVSECIASGLSDAIVADYLGHHDTSLLKHYRHRRAGRARQEFVHISFEPENVCDAVPGRVANSIGPYRSSS